MQIKIIETNVIVPSSPPFTDDHFLQLTHLDNDPNLRVTFRYVRAYHDTNSSPSPSNPSHVISAAISAALVDYYPLAATIRSRPDRRFEVVCSNGQGVPLIIASADSTLDSVGYLDDPAADFVEHLAPDPNPEEAMSTPCMLQLTVFNCGGFTLGAAIHHSLCDGMGATQFFNAAAEFSRGATRASVEPVWDRAGLLGPRDPPRIGAPVLHECLSLDKGFPPYGQAEAVGPVVRECFHVRDEWVEKFKGELLEQSGLNFTTFEALGAFIWRAKIKAIGLPSDEKVTFAYSINVRRLVTPALPASYWGNGCVPMYVNLTAKELTSKPLSSVADLIKKSKSNATDEYVRSFIDFQELHYEDGITAGKEVSGFTDWRHLRHSSVDFGWGGPVTVLPLSRNLLGSVEPCFFLPPSSSSAGVGKKDGFKVLVTMRESAVPAFREEMEKFGCLEGDLLSRI